MAEDQLKGSISVENGNLDLTKVMLQTTISYKDLDGTIKYIEPQKKLSFSKQNLGLEQQSVDQFNAKRIVSRIELEVSNAKQQLNTWESFLYNQFVDDKALIAKNAGRKPTDAMVKAQVATQQKIIDITNKLNQLKYALSIAKAYSDSLDQKSRLIQSQAALLREEINANQYSVDGNGENK